MSYSLTTKKSWSETMGEIRNEFALWGVKENDWDINYPRGARWSGQSQSLEDRTVKLTYKLRGQMVVLEMGKQSRAVDNLRVLYLAINDIRLNEVRGIGDIIASAYLQLNSGSDYKKSPYEVLGLSEGLPVSVYEAMYKDRVKKAHPDLGGSESEMTELNEAIEVIRKL